MDIWKHLGVQKPSPVPRELKGYDIPKMYREMEKEEIESHHSELERKTAIKSSSPLPA